MSTIFAITHNNITHNNSMSTSITGFTSVSAITHNNVTHNNSMSTRITGFTSVSAIAHNNSIVWVLVLLALLTISAITH